MNTSHADVGTGAGGVGGDIPSGCNRREREPAAPQEEGSRQQLVTAPSDEQRTSQKCHRLEPPVKIDLLESTGKGRQDPAKPSTVAKGCKQHAEGAVSSMEDWQLHGHSNANDFIGLLSNGSSEMK